MGCHAGVFMIQWLERTVKRRFGEFCVGHLGHVHFVEINIRLLRLKFYGRPY